MKSIFLFPYGGGSAASYRSYANQFPPDVGCIVPLEIPGRGKRSQEAYAKSIEECAALMLEQIDTASGDYILHGHSMGALLAFETVKLIEAAGKKLPCFMVASGRNAPRHVNDWLRRVGEMDDRGLFKQLQEIGGVPKGLSFAMAQPFLAAIRQDGAMLCDYEPDDARINVPILALAGKDDEMTNAAALAAWQSYTSKSLSVEWLSGEHYFILERPDRVASHVKEFDKIVNSSSL